MNRISEVQQYISFHDLQKYRQAALRAIIEYDVARVAYEKDIPVAASRIIEPDISGTNEFVDLHTDARRKAHREWRENVCPSYTWCGR